MVKVHNCIVSNFHCIEEKTEGHLYKKYLIISVSKLFHNLGFQNIFLLLRQPLPRMGFQALEIFNPIDKISLVKVPFCLVLHTMKIGHKKIMNLHHYCLNFSIGIHLQMCRREYSTVCTQMNYCCNVEFQSPFGLYITPNLQG